MSTIYTIGRTPTTSRKYLELYWKLKIFKNMIKDQCQEIQIPTIILKSLVAPNCYEINSDHDMFQEEQYFLNQIEFMQMQLYLLNQ